MAAPTGDAAALKTRYNPHSLGELHLNLWLRVPELKNRFDPTDADDLAGLQSAADTWLKANPSTLSWWGTGFAHQAAYLDKPDQQGFALGLGRPWTANR
ncbi:hypothetical protein AB0M80_10590 [Amycolatopsis sp. NPDC051045]|uniref:hypothetical protein n=1 Tax=Amycolatopsis sp. NPDC051045 TaxID=3156922 RepID=UPI003445F2B1